MQSCMLYQLFCKWHLNVDLGAPGRFMGTSVALEATCSCLQVQTSFGWLWWALLKGKRCLLCLPVLLPLLGQGLGSQPKTQGSLNSEPRPALGSWSPWPESWPWRSACFKSIKNHLLLFSLIDWTAVSDSLPPHELQLSRLRWLSLSPGICSNLCPLSHWRH